MKTRSLSILLTVVLMLSTSALFAGDKVVLPISGPAPYEFTPNYNKPGGVVLGPGAPRAFHYTGRQAVRDNLNRLHVAWESPGVTYAYDHNYYAHSTDTLGFAWTEAYDPVEERGVENPFTGEVVYELDRTWMPKMAINPVNGDIYMLGVYRFTSADRSRMGISRSTDNGETWTHYVDLGSRLDRPTEEFSFGTLAIGSDQILHVVYTKDSQDCMYTRANLDGLAVLDSIKFFWADGVTPNDEAISYVPSGSVFTGAVVLDRNDDPHVIFGADGGQDTYGDKTPYHIYYKSAADAWGPIPPARLFAELEAIWGMPEMVFDANNRGYYFFVDRSGPEIVFGTWEQPTNPTSAQDFGTLNNTGDERDNFGEHAVPMTVDNFANIEVTADDALYLPNADVDDANDIIYVVASSNDGGGSGGDIVALQLLNATTYDGQGPADMDWSLLRWITEDGDGLGDVGPDLIYDPSSSTLDVFWSGAGPATMQAQYFPAHIPKSPIDGQALSIAIVIPERWPIDKIYVNEGDTLAIVGVLKNNGTSALPPMPVTASIENSAGGILFSEDYTSIPLGAGKSTAEIEFGQWVVTGSRDDFSLKLKVNVVGDQAPFNDEVGTGFFVYPGDTDYLEYETFQDTNYATFPITDSDGLAIHDGGDWLDSTNVVGGWTVIDSSNGPFGDAGDEYVSTWFLIESTEDDYAANVRHMRGVRNDTLFGDIEHATLSDSAYAQPQNEVLLSPVYTISGTDAAYAVEWNDIIEGTDGDDNFPVYAFVDYTTDGGTTWNAVYHRSDLEGSTKNIFSPSAFLSYDLTIGLTGQTAVQFRFWWRNPNNDADYAQWTVDNVYLTTWAGGTTQANEPGGRTLPTGYALSQNYPNPFNPVTKIRYEVPVAGEVRIDIYNLLGQRVTTLVNGHVTAGRHEVHFDGRNLASGVYFYRLAAPNQVITRKMLLLK